MLKEGNVDLEDKKGWQAVSSAMPSEGAGHGLTRQPFQDLLEKENISVGDEHYLKLDSYKNNSQRSCCPDPVGFFKGYREGKDYLKYEMVSGNVSCGKWSCPPCRERNYKRLKARVFNGEMVANYRKKGFRDKYSQKFLTLTCPGKKFRSRYTILQAYEMMVKRYDKLIRALKDKYNDFKFLRVVEPQPDGYPHFHVVLVGDAISRKEILRDIERLWRFKYGMGFVKLNVVTNSLEHAIRYIMKYLSKNPVSMGKHKRIFTASRGALAPVTKSVWLKKEFYYGMVRADDLGKPEVIEYEVDVGECRDIAHLFEFMSDDLQEELIGVSVWKQKVGILEEVEEEVPF